MSRGRVVLCGVPELHCTGAKYTTDQKLPAKCHSDPEQAFNCMRRYLIGQGYEQIGARDFRPPDGGPIRVLTKKSRYGTTLRWGKAERFMPEPRDVGNRGVIIKT